MAPMKFYYDLMSQPSRALYIFLRTAKIPFDDHPIALRKGLTHKIVVSHSELHNFIPLSL